MSKYKNKQKKTAISGFVYSKLKNILKHYDFLDFLVFLELQQVFSEPSVLHDAWEAVVLQLDLEEEVSSTFASAFTSVVLQEAFFSGEWLQDFFAAVLHETFSSEELLQDFFADVSETAS